MNDVKVGKYSVIIAIDPDVDRNGIACLDILTKSLDIQALSFADTLDYLHALTSMSCKPLILVEAGWLNRSNWHLSYRDSKANAAAKGNAVGRNHEVGRKIAEMCEHWSLPYQLVKPLRKIWKSTDGKITATELSAITGYKGRTNQEGRDAALLAWVYAKFPIRRI
jgi:hypothetical protein